MTMATTDTEATATSPIRPMQFAGELARFLPPLQRGLGRLLKEVGSPGTPRELQHQLEFKNYATCWRIFRLVQAADLTAEARHAPSPGELKRVLALARGHGATAETVDQIAAAAEQFRTFVKRHAEDRSAFDSMVAGGGTATTAAAETLVVQRRRTAYRAMSHLWGVQTDLYHMTSLIGPRDPVDLRNYVTLTQQRGVRRLRTDAQVTLTGYRTQPTGPAGSVVDRAPLDPAAAATHGMPILPQFSSKPLPGVSAVDKPSGWRLYNMVAGEVGLRSNLDCTLAVMSGQPTSELDENGREVQSLSFTTHRKPIALLVLDLIVHRASFPGIRPRSLIHQYAEGVATLAAGRAAQRFPGEDHVAFAGPADRLALPEAPNYGSLLRFTAGAKGWDLAGFDAYRIRVPYPIFSTTTRVYFHTDSVPADV